MGQSSEFLLRRSEFPPPLGRGWRVAPPERPRAEVGQPSDPVSPVLPGGPEIPSPAQPEGPVAPPEPSVPVDPAPGPEVPAPAPDVVAEPDSQHSELWRYPTGIVVARDELDGHAARASDGPIAPTASSSRHTTPFEPTAARAT